MIRKALGIALALAFGIVACAGAAPQIRNPKVIVQAVGKDGDYAGFDLLSEGKTAAVVRLSSDGILTAARCQVSPDRRSLLFSGLSSRKDSGLRFGASDRIAVTLSANDPYPEISFDLTVAAFDAKRWRAALGAQPFHFLDLFVPGAEVWHQRGWLNATPLVDRFPLLQDVHVGTPEISAYHYNRTWSYAPPLSANPLPVIGLWNPRARHYAGIEFQTTRMKDNSERDIATAYHWRAPGHSEDQGQFVTLAYPYGGTGYQDLVFPKSGAHLTSRGTLLWSLDLSSTDDPNAFLWSYLWPKIGSSLPKAPQAADLSWLPGGARLKDFSGAPGPRLIGGVEGSFQIPGSQLIDGWDWNGENPSARIVRSGIPNQLAVLEDEARQLLRYAKRFRSDGDECVYWEKPLTGRWTDDWGGAPVTTLHNANGFAAGRLFLGLYRDAGKKEYLPVVDGVFNWARRIVWTRNEFADVPSSPFAIGGTLSAAFCLEYAQTFKNAPDAAHRSRAREALSLARSFTYRYMVMWPSDNDRYDGLDATFLWEPNSGRDWTGAACSNEVVWNLNTLAQTAVQTGDPILMRALQGSLDRWHLLYQEKKKPSLLDYQPGDMTEGYGLAPGNVYGLGKRAVYGFSGAMDMMEPVGDSKARVLAGDKAALVFVKGGARASVFNYRHGDSGDFTFEIKSDPSDLDLSLTAPYEDLSRKPVAILRDGKRIDLKPAVNYLRPPQALWSLYLKDVKSGDRILVGKVGSPAKSEPSAPPFAIGTGTNKPIDIGGFRTVPLAGDSSADKDWSRLDSWAGSPTGLIWAWGVPIQMPAARTRNVVVRPVKFAKPIRNADTVFLAYGADDGAAPSLLLANGGRLTASPDQETLAWRGWPAIYKNRLVVARIKTDGKPITGIDPGGRTVWAMTIRPSSAKASDGAYATAMKSWSAGIAEWIDEKKADKILDALWEKVAAIRKDSFAVIPPRDDSMLNLLIKAGLPSQGSLLSPDLFVDPSFFNAQRYPVALYIGGEIYLKTVKTPGDGAEALLRYVKDGGTLMLVGLGPHPLFYADESSSSTAEPLTARLGLPLINSLETEPKTPIQIRLAEGVSSSALPKSLPFPPGDPRLRCIDPNQLPSGSRYQSIYTVTDSSGKSYGDAAGIVYPANAKGRIVYYWGGLLRDPKHDMPIVESIIRYVSENASGK